MNVAKGSPSTCLCTHVRIPAHQLPQRGVTLQSPNPYFTRCVTCSWRTTWTLQNRVCAVWNKDTESHFLKEAFRGTAICPVVCVCDFIFFFPELSRFQTRQLVRADLKYFHTVSFCHLLEGDCLLSLWCLREAVGWQRRTQEAGALRSDRFVPATCPENSPVSFLRSLSLSSSQEPSFCMDPSLLPPV